MGNFKHEKIDLGYDDLATTASTGRTYAAPNSVSILLLLQYFLY